MNYSHTAQSLNFDIIKKPKPCEALAISAARYLSSDAQSPEIAQMKLIEPRAFTSYPTYKKCLLYFALLSCCLSGASNPVRAESPQMKIETDKGLPDPGTLNQLVIEAIWRSEFGKMLKRYFFSEITSDEVTDLSHQIVERMFSRGGTYITYVSALHSVIEDLYKKGFPGPQQERRLWILYSDLQQTQADADSYPGEGFAYTAVAILVAMLPSGSPQMRNLLKRGSYRVLTHVLPAGRMRGLLTFLAGSGPMSFADFRASRLMHEYSLKQLIRNYFGVVGPVSMVYFFWFDWGQATRGHSIQTQLKGLSDPEALQSYIDHLLTL